MFTKKPEKDASSFDLGRGGQSPPSGPMPTPAPIIGRQTGAKGSELRIGSDLTIIGNLVSKGEI